MKNIEIITTQNVVLQYELADVRTRAAAFVLDTVIIIVSYSILVSVFGAFTGSEEGQSIVAMLFLGLFCFYSLLLELFNNGQSIGKNLMKIRVIKVAGGRATFSDLAARWVFRLIDIYFSLGGIAGMLVMSSAKGQRIGDIIANTTVVKLIPKTDFDLKDILAIHNSTRYTPKYQQARKLREQDALLIKSTLERQRRFNNPAHRDAVALLADKIRHALNIEGEPIEDSKFLQTVLQDYVVLTR